MTSDFAHLAARAAKGGFALAQIDGRYFAARWAHEREFASLEEVAQWLDWVTGSNREYPKPDPQQVLKAEAARPDATARGVPVDASPGGGPMGAGQAAAAAPTSGEMPA